MKRNIIISLFIISFTLIGCSEKSATKYSNKDPRYAQLAKYTKIAKIVVDDEVKAIINITYLNGAELQKWDDGYQHFIIGSYISDKNFSTIDINRVVNNNLIKSEESSSINKETSLYKNIPFKNNWASYENVKFKNLKGLDQLVLKISLDGKYSQELSFPKEQSVVFDTFD